MFASTGCWDRGSRAFDPAGTGVEFADEAETMVVLGEGFFFIPGMRGENVSCIGWERRSGRDIGNGRGREVYTSS